MYLADDLCFFTKDEQRYFTTMTKTFCFLQVLFILLCLFWTVQVKADEQFSASVDKIKAAYLIHLSEFTTWPDEKLHSPMFSICISADSDLKQFLEEIEGRLVKNKPLKIQQISSVNQLTSCDVLYVDAVSKKIFEQDTIKAEPILTVSSEADFLEEGGVIQYYSDKDKVKMRVNLKALTKSKLVISSKLLRLMDSSF